MSETRRWLDELPWGAPERELLLAGKTARPPRGTADAEWQTLCLAVGATAASGVATTGVAVNAATTKAASAALASKAVTAGTWALGVKWFALGVALGCGTVGASAVVQRVSRSEVGLVDARLAAAASRVPARKPRSSAEASRLERPLEVTVAAAAALSAAPAVFPAVHADPPVHAASTAHADSTLHAVSAPRAKAEVANEPTSPPRAAAPNVTTALLAEQARDLADVKRLIDAGAAAEALRRLEVTRSAGGPFALSEERDALYVQALAKSGRQSDARRVARDFLIRYPESPYLEAMRRLLADE